MGFAAEYSRLLEIQLIYDPPVRENKCLTRPDESRKKCNYVFSLERFVLIK